MIKPRTTIHWPGKHVHLMGIGGCGMRALVPLLQDQGAVVSGCDLANSSAVQALRDHGVPVDLGHDPAHIDDEAGKVDVVVHTTAVPRHHPELQRARDRGCQVLSRPACLAALLGERPTVAVAGSHGKTSTTWMLSHILRHSGADPLVMVGGQIHPTAEDHQQVLRPHNLPPQTIPLRPPQPALGGGIAGSGWCVVEVDESDGGFQYIAPQHAIITNLEPEHQRFYGDFAGLCQAFADWIEQLPDSGRVIIPASGLDPRVEQAIGDRAIRVGLSARVHDDVSGHQAEADVWADNITLGPHGTQAEVMVGGRSIGSCRCPYLANICYITRSWRSRHRVSWPMIYHYHIYRITVRSHDDLPSMHR